MSIIKELKSQYSLIAWCPVKEHASLMAIASAKDLTPTEEMTPKTISLYDWSLSNIENCKYQAEMSLPSGATALSWGLTMIPNDANARGLICVGLENGSIQFFAPQVSVEGTCMLQLV